MKDFEKISTDQLWETIAENAQFARRHMNWLECLDNIRVLVALIDERIEVFQRRVRTEQLLGEHRGVFRLGGAAETGTGSALGSSRSEEPPIAVKGGDNKWTTQKH